MRPAAFCAVLLGLTCHLVLSGAAAVGQDRMLSIREALEAASRGDYSQTEEREDEISGPETPESPSPEQLREFAEALGVSPDGRQMRRLFGGEKMAAADLARRQAADDQFAQGLQLPPVIRHLRGNEGIPLPGPMPPPPELSLDDPKVQEALGEYGKYVEKEMERLTTPQDLPDCVDSKTERGALGSGKAAKDQEHDVFFDMLFMRSGNIPLDPQDVFGKETKVVPFSGEFVNGASFAAIGVGVKCLPTRFRVTGRYTFRHEGEAALRNYDDEPNGSGKVPPGTERMTGKSVATLPTLDELKAQTKQKKVRSNKVQEAPSAGAGGKGASK